MLVVLTSGDEERPGRKLGTKKEAKVYTEES